MEVNGVDVMQPEIITPEKLNDIESMALQVEFVPGLPVLQEVVRKLDLDIRKEIIGKNDHFNLKN